MTAPNSVSRCATSRSIPDLRTRAILRISRESLALVVVGVGIGVPLALAAACVLGSLLFGVTASDPLTMWLAA